MTSSISATNGAYTATAGRVREATEKSVETFKQGVERFTEQANVVARMPEIDLTVPVARYFEYVQKSVDFNRDLATSWAGIVTSLYAHGPGAGRQGHRHRAEPGRRGGRSHRPAGPAGRGRREEAGRRRRRGEARKQKGRRRLPSGPRHRRARKEAREQYEGLTKAELSDLFAERELPKSGTVDELIDRLVSADSQ